MIADILCSALMVLCVWLLCRMVFTPLNEDERRLMDKER